MALRPSTPKKSHQPQEDLIQGFRVQGSGFGVQGLGFGVQGLGFRVWGLEALTVKAQAHDSRVSSRSSRGGDTADGINPALPIVRNIP